MSAREHTAVPPAPTFNPCLEPEAIRGIRSALLIGLSSFGEIEKLDNAYRIHTQLGGESIPDDLRPIHPTGSVDTVSIFADALRAINTLEMAFERGKATE